ncbi:MAG: hypothetical protein Kow009_06650 [Spirochaetales bacterium]
MIGNGRRYIYGGLLLIGHLLLIGGIFLLVTNRMEKRFLQELRDTRIALETIQNNERLLAQDLNQAREILGLSVRTYETFDVEKDPSSPQAGERKASSPLFQAVETILSTRERQELEALTMRLLRSSEIRPLLETSGLKSGKEGGRIQLRKEGIPYVSFLPSGTSTLVIESYLGAQFMVDSKDPSLASLATFLKEQIPVLESHFSRMRTLQKQLISTCRKPDILAIANRKGLLLSDPEESFEGVRIKYLLKEEPQLVKLEAGVEYRKGVLFIGEERFDTVESFEIALKSALEKADTRTSKQIRLDSVLSSLRSQMEDAAFRQYLQSKGIRISTSDREDDEYRFIDLLDDQGKRMGSIGVLKIKGDVFLFDRDDVPISSLKVFTHPSPISEKKKSLNPPSP